MQKQKNLYRIIVFLLMIVLVGGACTFSKRIGTDSFIPEPNNTAPQPTLSVPGSSTIPVPEYSSLEGSLESLYEKVSPGVVSLQYTTQQGGGQGTGFVVDQDGHIVTNYHVAANVNKIEVHFASGLKVYGQVIGTDMDSDLAVIKVDLPADQLTPLVLGDSALVKVGQTVVAIGNPYGLSGTMTMGIVSARGRVLDSMRQSQSGSYYSAGDTIQTDALINPGNSGGPLLNLNGEVIGINRAIQTSGTTMSGEAINTGIGFAISSNILRKVLPSLIQNGTYAYPYLGMSSLSNLSLQNQELLKLPQSTGAYVMEVVSGGPADKAGLRGGRVATSSQGLYSGGDLIIAVDGQTIKDFSELMSYMVLNKNPGDNIVFTVLRNGNQLDLMVTLGSRAQ